MRTPLRYLIPEGFVFSGFAEVYTEVTLRAVKCNLRAELLTFASG